MPNSKPTLNRQGNRKHLLNNPDWRSHGVAWRLHCCHEREKILLPLTLRKVLPMPSIPKPAEDKFTYNELRVDRTVLIVITCNRCGSAKIVSHFDGTLEEWERGHQCVVRAEAS